MPFDERQRMAAAITLMELIPDAEALESISQRIFEGTGPFTISFVNAHAMNLLADDAEFWTSIRSGDLILRDGIGVALLLRLLRMDPGLNMNGTDYIPKLIGHGIRRGFKFYLLGTEAPYNHKAAQVISAWGGEVAWIEHGFHHDDYYECMLAERLSGNTMIILAMGMPKQERVASALSRVCQGRSERIVIINGGAILDFLGCKVLRAPRWVRRINCEWLYRLALEPKRLFRRYVIGNIAFLRRAVALKATNKTFPRHADR